MKLRIGARESRLAIAQAEIVADLFRTGHPEIETAILTMRTSGDLLKDKPLDEAGGKGLFTRELDTALLDNRIDIAVHSLKDIPAVLPEGLVIAAFCAAEDPRDALVLPEYADRGPETSGNAAGFDMTKPVGCSAKRRSVQLASMYPHQDYPAFRCAFVRGNVPTRLAKLDAGEYSALVLALSGLKRLGLEGRASRIFTIEEMLPAAGQGVLAVVTRETGEAARLAGEIDDPVLRRRALAERAFTRTLVNSSDPLSGGCGLPVAAFAHDQDGELVLEGRYCPDFCAAVGQRQDEADMIDATLRGDPAKPEELGRRLAFRLLVEAARRKNQLGSVQLVGAGPGDPGLLTARALSALAEAELVIFDQLVGPAALAKIPPEAEKTFAGKECGHHSLPQEEINALLVKKAAAGYRVVRFKGGDPTLFGRGGEEALCLLDAGIPCEIIPGVSSALAAPCSAGIPVTHRGVASRLHIIAAHGEGARTMDFSALARQCAVGDTLVFLMGASRFECICQSLVEAGLPGGVPAAAVSRGTTAKEKKVIATAATLAHRAGEAGLSPPAVIVIGEVCRLQEALAPCGKKPLSSVRIGVTRPREGVNRLAKMLDAQGAEVIEIPTIKIAPIRETPLLREILASLPLVKTWFAFTSVHGVEVFFEKLVEYRVDIRALANCRFAAVGNATCAALVSRGLIPDLVPEVFSGAVLGAALAKTAAPDERVILPRSASGGVEIVQALEAAGLRYVDIPLYDTVPETGYENPAFRDCLTQGLDYIAFTSPSGVEGFARIFGKPGAASPIALCIGEATASPARAYGMKALVPAVSSLEGMIEALLADHQKDYP